MFCSEELLNQGNHKLDVKFSSHKTIRIIYLCILRWDHYQFSIRLGHETASISHPETKKLHYDH